LEGFLELEDREKLGDLDSSREVTIEDFLEVKRINDPVKIVVPSAVVELEELLELEDGEKLEDLDSSREVTMEDFLEPPIWTEEAVGFHKRVKRINDPVKIVVPCAVVESADGLSCYLTSDVDREITMEVFLELEEPPICAEEAAGIRKRVKRIHDPVKIVVPFAVVEVEFPIPPDRSQMFSSSKRKSWIVRGIQLGHSPSWTSPVQRTAELVD
ncbi:hypothetical protein HID58_079898, partial [Brassica napus]